MKTKIIAIVCLLLTTSFIVPKRRENQYLINQSVNTEINTPDEALAELKAGNARFLANAMLNTDYKTQIEHTKENQHPHSLILSCLDSRVPPEIIFDQGIGNIFVARVAGNIVDADILGSMEFATKVKGTKLIVVMGHNKCGAVKGAIDNAQLLLEIVRLLPNL